MSYTPPSVDIDFLVSLLSNNPKIQGVEKLESSMFYIVKGNKPLAHRTVVIRACKNNEVDFEFATGIGACFKCMDEISEWLLKNKSWKDGGYIVKQEVNLK